MSAGVGSSAGGTAGVGATDDHDDQSGLARPGRDESERHDQRHRLRKRRHGLILGNRNHRELDDRQQLDQDHGERLGCVRRGRDRTRRHRHEHRHRHRREVGGVHRERGGRCHEREPDDALPGASNQSVTINGSGFTSGAAASFSGAGITVNSSTVNSATKLTANVSVSSSATIGGHDLTVTNADGGVGTCSACFHIISFAEVASATTTLGSSVTSSSFTVSAGTSYLVFVYSKSGSGDTAAPTSTFGTGASFNAVGSRQDYGTGAHNWAWYLTGASGTGTIKITFSQPTSRAFIEVIAIGGADTSNPIVTTNEGFAAGTGTTASANLPGAPGADNGEIVFWSTDSDNGNNNDPGSSSTLIAPVSGVYENHSTGSDDVFSGSPAQSSLSLTQNGSRNWGTIALEVNSS